MKATFSAKNACTPIFVGLLIANELGPVLIAHPVTQKTNIKRQKAKLEALKKEAEEERARAREAARERVLLDFERGQLGLGSSSAAGSGVGGKAKGLQNDKESTDPDESKPSGRPCAKRP